jgi:hypothetical protein
VIYTQPEKKKPTPEPNQQKEKASSIMPNGIRRQEPSSSINIGDKLKHKTFGDGVVVSFDGHYLVCRFDYNREKKFIYPDCFEKGYFI